MWEELQMKYDLSKKMTRGAKRTLESFSLMMNKLIAEKNFELITVNEMCELCDYPRATFYNYFDDKYDLLNYCWYLLSERIKLSDFNNLPAEQLLHIYFDRLYDLFSDEKEWLDNILKNNNLNDTLFGSFTIYVKNKITEIFSVCIRENPICQQALIPTELVAIQYSNTIILLLEWKFFNQHEMTKEQAHLYLSCFLEDNKLLEKIAED